MDKNIYERNRRVFRENRELARTKFKEYTDNMLNKTEIYAAPITCTYNREEGLNKYVLLRKDTVSTIIDEVKAGHKVCALNFADALTPGGLVEQGELTQEEDLCRCSNLYESLIKQECIKKYYNLNKTFGDFNFTDVVIYSRDVAFFRESSEYNLINNVYLSDILTCPAPIYHGDKENYIKIIKQRIRGMLNVMAANNVDTIILGAWGCGAFGGDANIVGRVFAEELSNYKCFDRVIFSIKSTRLDSRDNASIFFEAFNAGLLNKEV